ncbi:peptidylprolyl isomerase [Acidithiobacillus sp. CV18-2]|uniref:Peptidyl-prolyl cis-trans isomerase n=1 Tax=Igneacidithiobacillus copahuensis TaxID=2724909 RepID=A0AAE2YNZ9_9PROT|nr:peptidylprolyl isomerase [Igneacidithiobacillus copahuensis]MBU2754465.1 peptidylprolyl isomerase [Acidithiobacillus sp. CV18-3]MBU2756770.1 peptidylprolyl isomerase [Acidithiobacillus sp. BN09-2]MBU2778447.1 peptidylprolyl isomerase [Acidithiobacillus sp. CV18-2]MBU2797608.1 peptidylprolyl isomerase [Acidithiobacillus sp. VAN18-2]MBU2797937.1 peptidylprolyl isomerase [Acidithiobacillus sp. VAN18-4]UTV80785.1 peptidylprolyl isomerase [Acidithiobacillus sp. YTS05]
MKIAKDCVVTLDYTLTDEDGEILDSSEGDEPLVYLHGHGDIVPGLERALNGHQVGDQVEADVSPEDGYGDWDEDLVDVVGKEDFDDPEELEVGAQFEVDTDEGVRIATVIEMEGEDITVDLNHPLAGMNLHFAVKVLDVRAASAEELAHGHVHGPHGHEHD